MISTRKLDLLVCTILCLSLFFSFVVGVEAQVPAEFPEGLMELQEAEQVEVLQAFAGTMRIKLTALETAIDQKRQRIGEIYVNYEGDDLATMLALVQPKVNAVVANALGITCDIETSLASWIAERDARIAAEAAEAEATARRTAEAEQAALTAQ